MGPVFIKAPVSRDHEFPRLVAVGPTISTSDNDVAFPLEVRYGNGVGDGRIPPFHDPIRSGNRLRFIYRNRGYRRRIHEHLMGISLFYRVDIAGRRQCPMNPILF
jgi:hypothetical protein